MTFSIIILFDAISFFNLSNSLMSCFFMLTSIFGLSARVLLSSLVSGPTAFMLNTFNSISKKTAIDASRKIIFMNSSFCLLASNFSLYRLMSTKGSDTLRSARPKAMVSLGGTMPFFILIPLNGSPTSTGICSSLPTISCQFSRGVLLWIIILSMVSAGNCFS